MVIDPRDQNRLLAALERGVESGDFVDLRTRAFVYLLWDEEFYHVRDLATDPID